MIERYVMYQMVVCRRLVQVDPSSVDHDDDDDEVGVAMVDDDGDVRQPSND